MNNKKLLLIGAGVGVIIILFIVVLVSGLGYNDIFFAANSTYNVNGVLFKYPDTFKNASAPAQIFISSSQWQQSGYLVDNNSKIIINIQINPNTEKYTPQQMILIDESPVKETNGKVLNVTVLSTNYTTNPSNVMVASDVETITDPNSNKLIRSYQMIFSYKNGELHSITVQGADSDKVQLQYVQQIIYNSLKIS